MLKKLRQKFVLVNMLIVTCMLLLLFALVFSNTQARLDAQSRDAVQALLKGEQHPVNMPYFVVQVNVHGGLSVSGSSYYDLTDESFLQELVQHVYTAKGTTGTIKKYDLRYGIAQGVFSQKLVFVDISGQNRAMRSLVQSGLAVGALALAAFLGISVLLARWAVRPVERVWQQQKQFVSDASHELKTPLTVIMSNAELLQSPELPQNDRTQFADNILIMSRQMRKLVEGLLELARADNGQLEKSFESLDWSKTVEEALLPFEPVLFEKGLTLKSQIQPDIVLTGSESHLRQVVEILLDNAAKYAAPGVTAVRLQRQGKLCLLSVSTPGTPIAPQDRERIFGRFYRTDQARSQRGSFGLGLSIARAIVQEHGGRIWAESNETGNCFFVQLPC